MANVKPINVLVYSGPGASAPATTQTLHALRTNLSDLYVVSIISASALVNDPWPATCAALAIPGGADLPVCRALNGRGNARIRAFVERGGVYLGFCSGAYYASRICEFMRGDKTMEVVGERELGFFPGTKRGLAFAGFEYNSERGARAVKLHAAKELLDVNVDAVKVPEQITSYYNGGGVFLDPLDYQDDAVQVLATYSDELDCECDRTKAAVIRCSIGAGFALLTGPHPEFSTSFLNKSDDAMARLRFQELASGEADRLVFLKACFHKVGLQVKWNTVKAVRGATPIHVSSPDHRVVSSLLSALRSHPSVRISTESTLLKAEANIFTLSTAADFDETLQLKELSLEEVDGKENECPIPLVFHTRLLPSHVDTPRFNHELYFNSLIPATGSAPSQFGTPLMYADAMSSTSTVLSSNLTLQAALPPGAVLLASRQLAGRGRGSNAWSSPLGTLTFTLLLEHAPELTHSSPVVFVQYLAAMAVVTAVRLFQKPRSQSRDWQQNAEKLGVDVKLKWPNDIYACVPNTTKQGNTWVKIGGILVTSSYTASESAGSFVLHVGIGLNVSNTLGPTTCLNHLCELASIPTFAHETLLAKIVSQFEALYRQFCVTGWDTRLEDAYLDMWLHSGQIVTIESGGGQRARIKGITRDWGLLLAEELGGNDGTRPTGNLITLQSDNNSFDFFRGLIKKKH